VKKRTLKKICDYWESEASRSAAEAAAWRERYKEADRQLKELRSDPLLSFAAEFRSEALHQIDAWPQRSQEAASAGQQSVAQPDGPGANAAAPESPASCSKPPTD
jgi:hypothetical protein